MNRGPHTVEIVVGTGAAGFSDDQVNNPYGLTIGPDGALYFCDLGNQRIRRLDLATAQQRRVANEIAAGSTLTPATSRRAQPFVGVVARPNLPPDGACGASCQRLGSRRLLVLLLSGTHALPVDRVIAPRRNRRGRRELRRRRSPRATAHRAPRGVATRELVLNPVLPRHLRVVITSLLFSILELGKLGHVLVHVLGPREILRTPLCRICDEVPGKADDFRTEAVLSFVRPSGLCS
jgi:hypothetical protein